MSGRIRSRKMAREAEKNANQSRATDSPEIVIQEAQSEQALTISNAGETHPRESIISGQDDVSTEYGDDIVEPDELDDAVGEMEAQEDDDKEGMPGSRRMSSFSKSSQPRGAHILPQILLNTPELKVIYDEGVFEVDSDPPFITSYPDVEEMYHKALLKINQNCTVDVFRLELRRIYEVLTEVKSNEAELKRKLTKREREVEDLATKLKQEPRVTKALILAHRWRKEKAEAEEISNEYLAELNSVKADIRTMETTVSSLRKNNKRLTEDLEARKKLEKKIDELEELSLKKEQTITGLRQSLLEAKDLIVEARHQFHKEKEELMAKVDVAPKTPHSLLEDLRKQFENIKFENLRLRNENMDKKRSLKHLETTLKQSRYLVAELKKRSKESKRKCEKMVHRNAELRKSVNNLQQQKENLILLAQSLNTEGTRRGIHYKNMQRSWKKCEAEKCILIGKAQTQNKVIYNAGETNRELKHEVDRLTNELLISRELEENILQMVENANRQIQTLKNKLFLSDAKVNTGVAEVKRQKSLLHTAKANAENLGKNLKNIITEMKAVYYKMATCTNDNIDKNNLIRHMDSLCHQYQDAIRIRDAENDSLVISSQKMEHLLKRTRDSMLVLRQKNAEAATEAHMQSELFSLIKYMLKFTETEKETAVKIACKADDSIIIMKQDSAKRMHEILKLSEDVFAQKLLVKNFIKTLEHEKHENNHLIHLLHEADLEQEALIRKNYSLMHERDVLGAMVIRQKTENDLVLKKMEVMDSMLNAGYREVHQNNMDMRILKLEIRNLRRKLKSYQGIDSINAEIRFELVETSRALQLEKDKRAAIEKLKQTVPHPDRYVMHARVSEYELIMKIHKLQKVLAMKYNDCHMKETTIHYKNKQLLEMKLLLSRRPGVQCYNELRATKELVVRKNKQIKGLLSELNIARYDAEAIEKEREKLLEELRQDKVQLADYKRKAIFYSARTTTTSIKKLPLEKAKKRAPWTGLRLNITKPKMITATLTPLNK